MDIFKVDADTTKTDKLIDDTIQKFRSSPGSILVGTEMALPHLGDKIEHIAIASIDSLFALPDFRIQEKIMYLLIRLRAMATISILVQTRKPEEKVFEFGLKGNLNDFFRTTLVDRKQFEYPPYSTLVKITLEGKKDAIASKMAEIQKQIDPVEMDIFPAFTATLRGNSVIHGLIKLQPRSWPDPDLLTSLLALPPEVVVKIDPDSLL
jgi:primosomal protein N' (replication factor Y)